jgi:hypothetical protein
MDSETEHGYRGGWAGPIAVIVLIGGTLLVLGWFELGLIETLMNIH